MRASARGESGATMVTAMALLLCMMTLGLSSLSLVDVQTGESAAQRQSEASLQLAEGVLYAQAFVLARSWPGSTGRAYPATCASSATTTPQCPDRTTLAAANGSGDGRANFAGGDFDVASTGTLWTTLVRDNGGTMTQFYRPEAAGLAQPGCSMVPCTMDANGDGRVWLQVRTRVRDRPRSIVALLQLELFQEAFPRSAIVAGSVDITNNGNHGGRALVDVSGSQIGVRCMPPAATATSGNACVDFARASQIMPRAFVQVDTTPALSPSAVERLRSVAEANGTLYDGCPPAGASLAGAIVFVENCASGSYSGSVPTVPCPSGYADLSTNGGCINTPAKPGILIWRDGKLKFTGNAAFVGLIYAANRQSSSGTVLETGGGFQIYGAATIEGPGGLAVGSNAGPNIKYYPNVFNALRSSGTAGLVQNTWRELPPGS